MRQIILITAISCSFNSLAQNLDIETDSCCRYLSIEKKGQIKKYLYETLTTDGLYSIFINDLGYYCISTEDVRGSLSRFYYKITTNNRILYVYPDFPNDWVYNYVTDEYYEYVNRARKLPVKTAFILLPTHIKQYCVKVIYEEDGTVRLE